MPTNLPPSVAAREAALLAPYAMHSLDSRGRHHEEPQHPYRSPYQRDRDRIIHCAAFRRLSHKTQVFTGELGDYHRTRLTHTLEVASIARTIARALRLNEDLVESLALMHDMGHPPFGHAGEDALNECCQEQGGFNHNAQALRIVERLEVRYAPFDGLNLSQEILESQRFRVRQRKDATSNTAPLLEAQVVDAADSIAYDSHDADDALEIGLLELPDLLEIPLWTQAAEVIRGRYGHLDQQLLRQVIVRELIDQLVGDAVAVAQQRILDARIESVDDVRKSGTIIQASPEMAAKKGELESFLYHRVYRHPAVLEQRLAAQQALREMFADLTQGHRPLPPELCRIAASEGPVRAAIDYLAGLTDRNAWRQFRQREGAPREG